MQTTETILAMKKFADAGYEVRYKNGEIIAIRRAKSENGLNAEKLKAENDFLKNELKKQCDFFKIHTRKLASIVSEYETNDNMPF